MSRLRLVELAADPAAPAAGKLELYSRTVDKLARVIDESSVVRKIGNLYVVSNTADVGPTAGADFYIPSSAVPLSQLIAGSTVKWRITATKTAACTGTPTITIRVGAGQAVADAVLTATSGALLAQTAAIDTAVFEIEAIIRAKTVAGSFAWNMRMAHKQATTGFANAAQDQIVNGVTGTADLTTAGLFMGISMNPTATTANGVWTFQTVITEVLIG